jgi:hypothetical protein
VEVTLAVVARKFKRHADGTLDILGISTGMLVSAVPYVEPQLDFVLAFSAHPAEVGRERHIEVQVFEGDERLKIYRTSIVVPDSPRDGIRPSSYIHFPLPNVSFPRFGDYSLVVLVGDDEKTTVPFYVASPEGE